MKRLFMFFAMLHVVFTPFAEAQSASNAQSTALAYSQQMNAPIIPITEQSLQNDAAGATALLNANPAINNSSLGANLRQRINRINNYEAIKKGLSSCSVSDHKTDQQILAIAATLSPKDVCSCKIKGDPLAGAAEAIRLSTFEDTASKSALLDAVDSYFNIEMKYGKSQPDHIVDTVCGGAAGSGGDQCDANDRKLMQGRLVDLESGPVPQHLDDFHEFFTLNHGMATANGDLSKIEPQASVMHPVIDQNVKDQYAKYVQDYTNTANLQSGFLLATDTMQNYFGGLRRLPDDLHRGLFDYEFDQHHISNDGTGTENGDYGPDIVMQQAIQEALQRTSEQVQAIAKQDKAKTQDELVSGTGQAWRNVDKSKDDLEYLLNTNPQAIAKALMTYPGMTGDVCGIIQKTQADDARHALYHKLAIGAVVALGVAAAAFGGVALIGAAMGAEVATAGAIAAVVGVAAGGADVANAAVDYNQSKAQMLALQNQIFEHTGDTQTVIDYNNAVARLNSDVNSMVVGGVLTAAGAVASVPALMAAREVSITTEAGRALSATEEIEAAKDVDSVIEDVNTAAHNGQPMEQAFDRMSHVTSEQQTTKMLSEMADMSPQARQQLLGKLNQISEDPEKVKTLESAMEDAERSCGQ